MASSDQRALYDDSATRDNTTSPPVSLPPRTRRPRGRRFRSDGLTDDRDSHNGPRQCGIILQYLDNICQPGIRIPEHVHLLQRELGDGRQFR